MNTKINYSGFVDMFFSPHENHRAAEAVPETLLVAAHVVNSRTAVQVEAPRPTLGLEHAEFNDPYWEK